VATSEAQIDQLKGQLRAKDDALQESAERVSVLQARLDASIIGLEAAEADVLVAKDEAIQHRKDLIVEHEKMAETNSNNHTTEIELLQREHAKKSNIARALLAQREEENRGLTSKVKILQDEISSGAPNERRIFELAQTQAKREAQQGTHRDVRELAFVQLQEALVSRDMEVAQLYQTRANLERELIGLRRATKREGVNVHYLKNIVLQYMTFPLAAPERLSLVPVIATLLQFTKAELKEASASAQNPNWASRTVKEMGKVIGPRGGGKGNSISSSYPSSSSSPAAVVAKMHPTGTSTPAIDQAVRPSPPGGHSHPQLVSPSSTSVEI
jgi:hypothetical protein